MTRLIDTAAELSARPDMTLWNGPVPQYCVVRENRDGEVLVPETSLLHFAPGRALLLMLLEFPDGMILMQELVQVTERTEHGARWVRSESGRLRHKDLVCEMGVASGGEVHRRPSF